MATIERGPFERAIESVMAAALSARDPRGLRVFVAHPTRSAIEMAVLGAIGSVCGFPVTFDDEVPVSFGNIDPRAFPHGP